MRRTLFLPLGIIVAVLLALVLPWSGLLLRQLGPWLVMAIFVINGWSVKWREGVCDRRLSYVFVFCAVITLIGGPLLGRGVSAVFFSEPLMILGMTLMAASPTMIASAIVTTEVAGGNTVWALLFTLGVNLFSIASMPFMLKLCVSGMDGIVIDSWSLLIKLVTLMLLPFLAGTWLRRAFCRAVMPSWFGYVPSIAVIVIVYAALAGARNQLLGLSLPLLIKLAVAALLIHLILMAALAWSGKRLFALAPPENRALFFTGSQKSMVVGVSVLAALGGTYSAAAVVILAAYFLQLLFDSALAVWLSRRTPSL